MWASCSGIMALRRLTDNWHLKPLSNVTTPFVYQDRLCLLLLLPLIALENGLLALLQGTGDTDAKRSRQSSRLVEPWGSHVWYAHWSRKSCYCHYPVLCSVQTLCGICVIHSGVRNWLHSNLIVIQLIFVFFSLPFLSVDRLSFSIS